MTTPLTPIIDVRDLRFAWPKSSSDCVSIDQFTVPPGEAVFVHGPSGCGKSTLLSLLCGVLVADSGSIHLMGRDWRAMPVSRRDAWRVDRVGYIFQQFNLLPFLSAIDNVLLPCRFSQVRRERASVASTPLACAESLLNQFGLDAALWRRPATELSVGQQQRVAAARALIGQPEVLIADEPTSALDEATRDTFMTVLRDACQHVGSAIVFVSHDLRLAKHFDRMVDLPMLNRAAAPLPVDAP